MTDKRFWFLTFPAACLVAFIAWFIPWVAVLHFGFLVYFPYKSDGHTRFMRVSGPVAGMFTNNWTPGKNIPSFCKYAVVAAEDANFFTHHGVDFNSISKSIKTNEHLKKIKRGGSTITQQIVKNAFLSRNKNYVRKAREITGAFLLDAMMSKDSQLTWYLNLIEFGNNVYGIDEAAHFYFHTTAQRLSPSQCIALASIVPSPKKWNKSLVRKQFTPFFVKRYHTILKNIANQNFAHAKDINLAQQMSLWGVHKPAVEVQPPKMVEPLFEEDESDADEDE